MKKIMFAVVGIALALGFIGCAMEVNDPVRNIPIVAPYITVQPQSQSINVNDFRNYPTLRVTVADWRGLDGRLSYQWYSFTSIEEYCKGNVTEINNATNETYTPRPQITAGSVYYYYVVVTNDYPDALEGTSPTAEIQSDVAIISFHNNSMAPMPIVTKYPVGAEYTIGRQAPIAPLEVRAVANQRTMSDGSVEGGTLSFQWYANDVFSVVGGTLLTGATTSSYMPDPDDLKKGDNFYYVVIINTFEGETSFPVFCMPVNIEMLPAIRAATPRITVQPRNQTVFTANDALKAFEVDARVNDGGDVTFQWYSADKAAATKGAGGAIQGKLIAGATSATYAPEAPDVYVYFDFENADEEDPNYDEEDYWLPLDTATAGKEYYYYAVATNTNLDVLQETTAETKSKVATIKVAASVAATGGSTMPTISLKDPRVHANLFQYVRGYGGMDVAWANFPGTTKADTELMYNPDWGLGYNILRIMIVPPGTNQANYTNHKDIIEGRTRPQGADQNWTNEGWTGLLQTHRPFYIDNVKVVNEYGGYVLASPWTPPKEWKENNSINSGGALIHAYYKSFANYLREFCQYMYYKGAPVYAVSIANEPNYAGGYDGCEWSNAEMRDFFIQEGQFTRGVRGYGGGKSIPRVLIVNGESANTPTINDPALNDPRSRAAIDFYARHVYGAQIDTLWGNPYASWEDEDPYQTECWMTEHNINSANALSFPNDSTWNYVWRFLNDVDLVIRLNNENAFVWWASKRFYSFLGDGTYSSGGDTNTWNGDSPHVTPRGYGLSHYAKYSNETTRLDFEISGNMASGTSTTYNVPIDRVPAPRSNFNYRPTPPNDAKSPNNTVNLDDQSVKITAFVSRDGTGPKAVIKEISLVMWTPTNTSGGGGYSLGRTRINMPAGFQIDSAQAVKSNKDKRMEPEPVEITSGRDVAYVELFNSEILSVRFTVSEIKE